MAIITTSLSVNVKQGPQVSMPPIETKVEAYDQIDISIASGSENVAVNVQPGGASVSFLLITSSAYGEELTYKPKAQEIALDKPQLYLGAGSIATLLGDVTTISFTNKLPETPEVPAEPATETTPAKPAVPAVPAPTVEISILVGRDATP